MDKINQSICTCGLYNSCPDTCATQLENHCGSCALLKNEPLKTYRIKLNLSFLVLAKSEADAEDKAGVCCDAAEKITKNARDLSGGWSATRVREKGSD